MGLIGINGLRIHAYHGVHAEERVLGGYYRVDLTVSGDLSRAESSDHLADTLDYARMVATIRAQMTMPGHLIEHVARRTLDALRAEWPGPYRWKLRLVKECPPVGADVVEVSYTLEA